MNTVDTIIAVCCVFAAWTGYRSGAVLSVLSFAGFLIGAIVGAQFGGPIAERFADGTARAPIALAVVFSAAALCQAIAGWLGSQLRSQMTWKPARAVDAALGSVASVLATLVVAWLVAVPLASSPSTQVASAVRSSRLVEAVDGVLPSSAQDLYRSMRTYLDDSGFPQVFGALDRTEVSEVPAPDPALSGSPVVAAVEESVLKVRAAAPSCDRQIEGSSFVYAPEHVLTNAHVVAGANTVRVLADGETLAATVVLYDAGRDIAVLYVPGLDAPALPFAAGSADTGDDAIVLGYPHDGPYDARSARVRDHQELNGRDIYGESTVVRDVYALRTLVRSGNSGGPLITPDGEVLGLVFAAARDEADTGFALSNAELHEVDLAGAAEATARTGTGSCA